MATNTNVRSGIDKLKGRINYDTWRQQVKGYLTIKDLYIVIAKDIDPDESPLTNAKCIAEITLLVETSLLSYITNTDSAKEVWDSLANAFEDRGTTRKITILKQLISVKLTQFQSMEKYIDAIIVYYNKTKAAGLVIGEEIIASLMLAGLPDEYLPMILGIENSGAELTIEYVKTILLQGIPDPFQNEQEDRAMPICLVNKKGNKKCFKCGSQVHLLSTCPKRGLKCTSCGDIRHLARNCRRGKRKPQKKKASNDATTPPETGEKSMIAFLNISDVSTEIRNSWFIDSGATAHMCNNIQYFDNYVEDTTGKEVLVANKSRVKIFGTGTVRLCVNGREITFKKVVYAPDMVTNLISVRRITENGFQVLFSQGRCRVIGKEGDTVIEARLIDGMYKVKAKPKEDMVCLTMEESQDIWIWHKRLGHPSFASMKKLVDEIGDFQIPSEQCKTCVLAKQTRNNYPYKGNRATEVLELVHTDVNGPLPSASLAGSKYFVTFIDDYSKKIFLYTLKLKSEVFEKFKEFKTLVENQTGKKIKRVRSDNGGEYDNKKFTEFSKQNGIILERTIPYTPQQNGVSERFNRTIMEKVRALLIESNLGFELWGEACNTAVYLLNLIPKGGETCSPNELWNGERTSLSKLRIFGEIAMGQIPKEKRGKLDPKAEEYLIVGYEENGYRLYDPRTKAVIRKNDVVFLNQEEGKEACLTAGIPLDEHYAQNITKTSEIPNTHKEAIESEQSKFWITAMDEEYKSLIENETWKIEELPKGKNAIKTKWVFCTKNGVNGEILRYKARLVAKGYSQIEGIDYQETFAPVVRYTSIRILLSYAAHMNLKITQMDAVTAFLNGYLSEEIYIEQPEGYADGTGRYCKLIKSIYGLKQSPRVWNETLNEALIGHGLTRSISDQCIYSCTGEGKILIVAVYVDDILIFSNSDELDLDIRNKLKNTFKMKDLGEASSILGIRITRKKELKTITIDQENYVQRILKRFNMEDCNPVTNPLETGLKLSKDMSPTTEEEKAEMKGIPYRQAVGSLLFLAMISRPDICFAVNALSRYCNEPGKQHWNSIKRVLRYIKGTASYAITYGRSSEGLVGYSDADWGSDKDDRRSITGYVFLLYDGAISWACKKQPTVALSTTEAEYMASTAAIQEAIWVNNFMNEILKMNKTTTVLFCDNKGAMGILNNNSYSSRTKHIDIKARFIRENLENKSIEIKYVPTADMTADILTKATDVNKLRKHITTMGLNNKVI